MVGGQQQEGIVRERDSCGRNLLYDCLVVCIFIYTKYVRMYVGSLYGMASCICGIYLYLHRLHCPSSVCQIRNPIAAHTLRCVHNRLHSVMQSSHSTITYLYMVIHEKKQLGKARTNIEEDGIGAGS